jgi:cytidylate kinase
MKTHIRILPGVEKRLSAWNQWALRQAKEEPVTRPCITISREFGCQAYPLAETLHKRLNEEAKNGEEWTVLDRLLLETIAVKSGYAKAELEYITSVDPTFQSMITTFMGREHAAPFEVFTYIKKTVRYFAKAGNSIIVGRGGVCLTQDLPNAFHVRLVAPLSFKLKTIMNYLGGTEDEAKAHIEARQAERDEFTNHFTRMSLYDPHLYHLMINNDKFSIAEIAEIVIDRVANIRPRSIG